ncbi:MAG TPA: NAD(P)-dependent oxidoreductase [Solirubrobacteraceae bacterium]|nr:NAD(P)-dependent oxidoreductase [Solirubrobacteraceae bacterium]
MRIGWLGTGIMGAPMARHVAAAGNEVVVWNRTRSKADGIAGVTVADSPGEAVKGAEIVVTMLSDGAAVEEVVRDADLPAEAIWWQASTVGLEATERLKGLGPTYVDAPVLGTKQPAEDAKLTVLAAGPHDALDKLEPLFDAVGAKTIRFDEVGDATRAKLVMNHWVLALTTATAETIALARSLGVDPKLFLEGIAGGPLDSAYAQMKGALILEEHTNDASFPLRLAHKDARLIVEADPPGELAPAVERAFARGADAGLGDHDMAAVGSVSEASAPRS